MDGSLDKCTAKGSTAFYRIFASTKEYQNTEKEILLCFKISSCLDGGAEAQSKQIDTVLSVFQFGPTSSSVKLEQTHGDGLQNEFMKQ